FPFFHIDDSELAWDWNSNKSNYTDLRAQKEQMLGAGKTWEIESSTTLSQAQLMGYQGGSADQYYDAMTSDGGPSETASQVQAADFATMFHGIATPRVTRMRSDVAHAQLATGDLVLTASADQSELSTVRQVTKELNEPQCPVYQGCDVVGQAPRDQAAAQSTGTGSGNETGSCATAPTSSRGWLFAGIAIFGLAIVKARARRRRAVQHR
ncbi:MAG TPA: hypothetical protein VIF62_33060, partial [Labilithrix sp.]